MKQIYVFLTGAMLAAALATGVAAQGLSPRVLLDSYAAIVNGKVITLGEVLEAMRYAQEELQNRYTGAELQSKIMEEYQRVRDQLVESELILLDFQQQGIVLPDRAIEDHINSVITERFQNDRAAFLEALAAERLTYNEWREQMKDQLIAQVLRQKEVLAKVLVTPYDIQQAYDKNIADYSTPERVRLQFLVLAPDSKVNATRMSQRFAEKSLTFEDAAKLGSLLSDDDPVELDHLNADVKAAISGLTAGGISAPVVLDGSTYFIRVAERLPAHVQPLEEVSTKIEQKLRRSEFERLNKIWMDSLRHKYFVQLFQHDLFD